MIRSALSKFASDRDGVSAVEFAIIAPVFLMTMFGVLDLGHHMYTSAVLQGAVQKAARDATIEGSAINAPTIDRRVEHAVRNIAPKAKVKFKRTSYSDFSGVGQPEDFTDLNNNGVCDAGEPFEDANGNDTWDTDRGRNDTGGAKDAVLYEVEITYDRLFPAWKLLNQDDTFTMIAKTVLRNQPFGAQDTSSKIGNCA